MSHVLGKVSIYFFFLYLTLMPGLMSVTFLLLKYFDTPALDFIRTGRLVYVQIVITDKYFESI